MSTLLGIFAFLLLVQLLIALFVTGIGINKPSKK